MKTLMVIKMLSLSEEDQQKFIRESCFSDLQVVIVSSDAESFVGKKTEEEINKIHDSIHSICGMSEETCQQFALSQKVVRALHDARKYLQRILDYGHMAEGGEQDGNRDCFYETVQEVNEILEHAREDSGDGNLAISSNDIHVVFEGSGSDLKFIDIEDGNGNGIAVESGM